jgi:hypothetical protein
MSKLAEVYIHLNINLSPDDELLIKEYLAQQAELFAKELIKGEFSIEIEIDYGTIKFKTKVLGSIFVIFEFFSNYADFQPGLEKFIKDSQNGLGSLSRQLVIDAEIPKDRIIRMENRSGVPGLINQLIKKVEKLKKERSNQARFRGELQEVKNMVDKIYKELDSENESNVFTTELINEINNFFPELADMQPQISRQTSDSQEAHSISYAFGIKRVLQEEKLFIAQSEEEDELFFPINKEKLRSRLKKK